jgi:hypothetical protein
VAKNMGSGDGAELAAGDGAELAAGDGAELAAGDDDGDGAASAAVAVTTSTALVVRVVRSTDRNEDFIVPRSIGGMATEAGAEHSAMTLDSRRCAPLPDGDEYHATAVRTLDTK